MNGFPLFLLKIASLFELRILFGTKPGMLFENSAEMGEIFIPHNIAYRIHRKVLC